VEGKPRTTHKDGNFRTTSKDNRVGINSYELSVPLGEYPQPAGRFPANLIHDGSQQVLELFPETKARGNKSECMSDRKADIYEYGSKSGECGSSANKDPVGFVGSAARFFYCPKASKKDRDEGLEGFEEKIHQSGMGGAMPKDDEGKDRDRFKASSRNHHPTVKPTALMQYLCRLITPTGGVVLDPYMGSGSTGKAAVKEGFSFVGCELDEDYFKIATARIK
jgi:site-specific DNA-methyltransferase (adenine-specific)